MNFLNKSVREHQELQEEAVGQVNRYSKTKAISLQEDQRSSLDQNPQSSDSSILYYLMAQQKRKGSIKFSFYFKNFSLKLY